MLTFSLIDRPIKVYKPAYGKRVAIISLLFLFMIELELKLIINIQRYFLPMFNAGKFHTIDTIPRRRIQETLDCDC